MGLDALTAWVQPDYSLGMKTWMIPAALALLTAPASAEVGAATLNPVAAGARVSPGLPALGLLPLVDDASRAGLLKEMEASRTALLPQTEPLQAVTVRFQARLNALRDQATAAMTPAALEKSKKDFNEWKYEVIRALYAENQKAFPGGTTYAAFSTQKAREISFVLALHQQFAAQRVESQAASVREASLSAGSSDPTTWTRAFDGAAPKAGETPAPVSDGAVKAAMPTGAAKYKKLRDIAVNNWGASPKIVDAAIAESIRQNVDPALVLAVIWQESRFNPHATSNCGARGLMQVMPDTGVGLGVSDPGMLYDIKTNLRAGVHYLRNAAAYLKLNVDLSDISDAAPNKIKALLASYNAGCGAVSKWLRQQGENLVRIPYAETRHYVRVIGDKLASLGESLGW